jgi:L-ectoine synthase
MKTVDLKEVTPVKFNGGNSYRTVLKKDGLGFAMMETRIDKGGPYKWHYKNHLEACMCISGVGILKDLLTGEKSEIRKGITYLVDNNQPHEFTALTDVVLVSVFNPPLTGLETHDKDGSYNIETECKRTRAVDIVTAVNNSDSNYDAIEKVETLI